MHISLPCKGGSPLLNFWGRNEKHEKEFFYLLKSSGKYLDEIKSYLKECLSLFRSNCRKAISTWKSRDLENFFEKHGMAYQSECHACSMDWKPRVDFELAKFSGFRVPTRF